MIEGIDIDKGIAMVGGSRTGYFEILEVFSNDAAQRLDMLRKLPIKEELHFFTTQVHALKSASASIGAGAVSQKAAALEAAGQQGDLEAIGARLEDFFADLEALVRGIHDALHVEKTPAAGAGEGQPEIPEEVRQVLEQLRRTLEDEEILPIEALVKNLKAMELSPPLRQVVGSIADCVLVSEFSQAIEIVDGLLTP